MRTCSSRKRKTHQKGSLRFSDQSDRSREITERAFEAFETMADNDDDDGFGDFKFVSSSSSHLTNGPDFFTEKTTTITAGDDDDWGDFINSNNGFFRKFHFDPFPNSSPRDQPDLAPSQVELAKNQWAKVSGALPLSFFGEEEKEEEGSGAVDAGVNGLTDTFSFPKKDGNSKGKGSNLNDLIVDLYKQSENEKQGNGFTSGFDVKEGVSSNPKETCSWNGLNLGLNGSGLKVDGLDLSGNAPGSGKKEENLASNSAAFGKERKEGEMGLSGLDLGSNGPGVGQSLLTLDSNGGSSDLVDEEDDDDGWEFQGAESKAEAGVANLKVKFILS